MHDAIKVVKETGYLLSDDDQKFVNSLVSQFEKKGTLSDKQWHWLEKLAARALALEEGVPDFTGPDKINVGNFNGVIELFKTAKQHLKYPKIKMQTDSGRPVALSLAGEKSKRPGTVNVTDGGPFHANTWYGRISPDGSWEPSKAVKEETLVIIRQLLSDLAAYPAETAAKYGKLHGICCFCSTPLSDERSTSVGYGPVCAKHWNLPWG